MATPVFIAALDAFKVKNGLIGSLPVFADQLAIGCLLAAFAPRLPKIPGYVALTMVAAMIFSPWFPATSPWRTLFMLFVLPAVAQCFYCRGSLARYPESVSGSELDPRRMARECEL
jgi:hypothetical protein